MMETISGSRVSEGYIDHERHGIKGQYLLFSSLLSFHEIGETLTQNLNYSLLLHFLRPVIDARKVTVT